MISAEVNLQGKQEENQLKKVCIPVMFTVQKALL
jgi:hypothetical protein